MVMFHSHVSLPEGICQVRCDSYGSCRQHHMIFGHPHFQANPSGSLNTYGPTEKFAHCDYFESKEPMRNAMKTLEVDLSPTASLPDLV